MVEKKSNQPNHENELQRRLTDAQELGTHVDQTPVEFAAGSRSSVWSQHWGGEGAAERVVPIRCVVWLVPTRPAHQPSPVRAQLNHFVRSSGNQPILTKLRSWCAKAANNHTVSKIRDLLGRNTSCKSQKPIWKSHTIRNNKQPSQFTIRLIHNSVPS